MVDVTVVRLCLVAVLNGVTAVMTRTNGEVCETNGETSEINCWKPSKAMRNHQLSKSGLRDKSEEEAFEEFSKARFH